MSKTNECRFNLTLNAGNPLHRTAINALNSQGRHKSQFVVNAITHFIMSNSQASVQSVQPNRAYIEAICEDVVRRYLNNLERRGVMNKPIGAVEEFSDEGDIDINSELISETLESFRKK